MITRLDENTAKQRRIDFEKDDAYVIIYDTIDWLSTDYHSLSPEELWQEASDLIDEIRNAPDKEWKSTKLFNQLVRKYAELDSAKETATIVLYIVTWMLVRIESDKDAMYLRSLPLHASQNEPEPCVFEWQVAPTFDFIQQLRTYGSKLEVLAPQSLREKFADEAKHLYKMYV